MTDKNKHKEEPKATEDALSNVAGESLKTDRSRLRRVSSYCCSAVMLVLFIVVGFQFGGLLRYAHSVSKPMPPIEGMADGIVVLTGGENRIRTAMGLLSQGKAKQLLITGVNSVLSENSLKRTLEIDEALFNCCVEIDWSANDTIGNALATKKWVHEVKAETLVVVTGAFHMPRALKELRHAMSSVEFIAAPVNVPTGNNWWRNYSRLRDMLREYAKLVFVSGRDRLNAWTGTPWPTIPLWQFDENTHLSTINSDDKKNSQNQGSAY